MLSENTARPLLGWSAGDDNERFGGCSRFAIGQSGLDIIVRQRCETLKWGAMSKEKDAPKLAILDDGDELLPALTA